MQQATTKNLIRALFSNNQYEARVIFNQLVRDKTSQLIQKKHQQIGQSMFKK